MRTRTIRRIGPGGAMVFETVEDTRSPPPPSLYDDVRRLLRAWDHAQVLPGMKQELLHQTFYMDDGSVVEFDRA